jgi:hypothetical protein
VNINYLIFISLSLPIYAFNFTKLNYTDHDIYIINKTANRYIITITDHTNLHTPTKQKQIRLDSYSRFSLKKPSKKHISINHALTHKIPSLRVKQKQNNIILEIIEATGDILQPDFYRALETTPEYLADCMHAIPKIYPGNITSKWYFAALPALLPRTFLEQLHNQYNSRYTRRSLQKRIPAYIHQIWIGTKPIPEQYKKWQKSWQEKHPRWQYKLWTNIDVAQYTWSSRLLKLAYHNAVNYAAQADILRFDILYQYGGVYIDIDTQALEPLDGLISQFDFFAILYGPHKGTLVIDTFFIGAIPHHPILARTLQLIEQYAEQLPDVSYITRNQKFIKNLSMGVMPFTQSIAYLLNKTSMRDIILPMSYFAHYRITPWSYGVHYPARTWSVI